MARQFSYGEFTLPSGNCFIGGQIAATLSSIASTRRGVNAMCVVPNRDLDPTAESGSQRRAAEHYRSVEGEAGATPTEAVLPAGECLSRHSTGRSVTWVEWSSNCQPGPPRTVDARSERASPTVKTRAAGLGRVSTCIV